MNLKHTPREIAYLWSKTDDSALAEYAVKGIIQMPDLLNEIDERIKWCRGLPNHELAVAELSFLYEWILGEEYIV